VDIMVDPLTREYRLYCFDGSAIQFAQPITADSDEEAIAVARELKRHSIKCEVWQGRRLVTTLQASDLIN